MSKGKTHCRGSRCNIVRSNINNARRKARKKAKIYDLHDYDKPTGSEPLESNPRRSKHEEP